MTTWSLCMIVKNEEKNLDRCLKSTKDLFNEIIIVDTGSTDKTKEIAKKYTKKIYDFKWINDFSAARNYAFSKATKDYQMWLDADDIIKDEDYLKLKKLKKSMKDDIDLIMLKYNISFDSDGKANFTYYRERIFKCSKNYKWHDKVHEFISLTGNILREDIAITHKKEKQNTISYRNLNIYKEMEKNGETFTPRNLYYYGRELNDHNFTREAINILTKFLQNKSCWIEDKINACIILYDCFLKENKKDKAISYLYQTFNYDVPRPKPLSLIGSYFLEQKLYQQAIYWYQQAINSGNNEVKGFYEKEYSDFIPLINLVVCYDRIGNKELARDYHEKVKLINSSHPSVIYNDKYFNT